MTRDWDQPRPSSSRQPSHYGASEAQAYANGVASVREDVERALAAWFAGQAGCVVWPERARVAITHAGFVIDLKALAEALTT